MALPVVACALVKKICDDGTLSAFLVKRRHE